MSFYFYQFIDIVTRVAGLLALLIIAIPKLTEMVLNRYLLGALEKQKQMLQIQAETHKNELSKSLEAHKAQLQQAQIEEQRKYSEKMRCMDEVSQHIIGTLKDLFSDIQDSLTKLSASQELTYKEITSFLDRANARNIKSIKCLEYLEIISEECEKPGAMIDNDFTEGIRKIMIDFARATEAEIIKLKGGAGE